MGKFRVHDEVLCQETGALGVIRDCHVFDVFDISIPEDEDLMLPVYLIKWENGVYTVESEDNICAKGD